MARLTYKILLIAVLTLVCNLALNKFFFNTRLPAIYGDKQLLGKYNTLVKNDAGYNTIFIGSSKTHYHIAPQVFDSVLNAHTGGNVKSYNFGIDGMLPMESFQVCKQLLLSSQVKLKTIVFELVFPKTNDTQNIFAYRGFYWVNGDGYRAYNSVITASGLSKASKIKNLGYISFMRGENILNLGKLSELASYYDNRTSSDPDQPLAGFEGLPANKLTDADNMQVDATKLASLQAHQNFDAWSSLPINQAYLNEVNELSELARQHNIKLIYTMPMLWGYTWQYKELLPIYHRLPQNSQLIMADANQYPQHFDKRHLFDAIHLSKASAIKYTEAMALAFADKKLINY